MIIHRYYLSNDSSFIIHDSGIFGKQCAIFKVFVNCDSQSDLRLKQNKMNAEYHKHPGTTTFLKRKMQYFKFYFLYFGFFFTLV